MSDLAAAAAAMGVPESLVERSAEARAQETGSSVEEILTTWAGGASAPASSAPAITEAEPAETPDVAEAEAEASATSSVAEATELSFARAEDSPSGDAVSDGKPPVLVGSSDNPMTIMIGAIALFALIFLVGLIGPSVQADTPGARSSDITFTAAGEEGLAVYSTLGCAACHTQMVRPVVADVGLGGVTLNDANQPLGTRRFGPDLSDVGSRLSGDQMEAIITGFDGHPSTGLSSNDMNALVAYLTESNTSGDGS